MASGPRSLKSAEPGVGGTAYLSIPLKTGTWRYGFRMVRRRLTGPSFLLATVLAITSLVPGTGSAKAVDGHFRWDSWSLPGADVDGTDVDYGPVVSEQGDLVGFIYPRRGKQGHRLIFRGSQNHGRSWKAVAVGHRPIGSWAVASSGDGRTVALVWWQRLARQDRAVLSMSTDSGRSWTSRTLGSFSRAGGASPSSRLEAPALLMSRGGRRIVAGTRTRRNELPGVRTLRTTDRGDSWASASHTLDTDAQNWTPAFSDSGRVLAVGHLDVAGEFPDTTYTPRVDLSSNGGRSWSRQDLDDPVPISQAYQVEGGLHAAVSATGSTAIVSWTSRGATQEHGESISSAVLNTRHGEWSVHEGLGGHISMSHNGRRILVSGSRLGADLTAHPSVTSEVWISRDAGSSWVSVDQTVGNVSLSGLWVRSATISRNGRRSAFLLCDSGDRAISVLSSTDVGRSWHQTGIKYDTCDLMASPNGKELAVYGDKGLRVSHNAGMSWRTRIWRQSPTSAPPPRVAKSADSRLFAFAWPDAIHGGITSGVRRNR